MLPWLQEVLYQAHQYFNIVYNMNHDQLVYMSDIPPSSVQGFMQTSQVQKVFYSEMPCFIVR